MKKLLIILSVLFLQVAAHATDIDQESINKVIGVVKLELQDPQSQLGQADAKLKADHAFETGFTRSENLKGQILSNIQSRNEVDSLVEVKISYSIGNSVLGEKNSITVQYKMVATYEAETDLWAYQTVMIPNSIRVNLPPQ